MKIDTYNDQPKLRGSGVVSVDLQIVVDIFCQLII